MKKRVIAFVFPLLLMIVLAGTATAANVAEKGEKVFLNGHTYQLLQASMTWDEMENYCESIGGYLACITSAEEDAFLFSYIRQNGQSNVFFGFTDNGDEGYWRWISGEPTNYTNWGNGEPNNSGGKEHWGEYFSSYSNGEWNDDTQSATSTFLCEWNYITHQINVVEKADKVSFNGHTYQLFGTSSSWHEIKSYCESRGGHLACITSAEEDDFLFNYIRQSGEINVYFGFTDEGHEGQWVWVTGEPVDYTNWGSGEPNNVGGSEHWGQYFQDYPNGQWNDEKATGFYAFLCEWEGRSYSTPIKKGEYCFHVTDENGNSLSGVTVTWKDDFSTVQAQTESNGNAYFSNFSTGTPVVTAELTGYITWTNANSGWEKSGKRYSEIVLYSEAHGAYKLASAYYSNVGSETSWCNLLTSTKKLNLKNDGNLVGDLDFGNFYLTCTACTMQGIERYELWQNSKFIAQCNNGRFPRLSVTSFSKGGGCFVRVIASDGTVTDTNINLEFTSNTVQKETGVSILKDRIAITVSDNIPFLGGSTFNVGGVGLLPVEVKLTEKRLYIGFNSKIWSSSDSSSSQTQTQGKFDKFKKSLQTAMKANTTLGKRDADLMNTLMKMEHDFDLPGGSVKFNVIGYAEANWGSSTATGELYIICRATTPTLGFTTWVVVVPVTVQISGYLQVNVGAKISYNFENSTFNGEIPLNLTLGLDAFGGVRVGKAVGVGAYGSANVAFAMQVFFSPFLKSIDLTGDLGIKAYFGPFEYRKSFAHNTWHLYTANNVRNAKLQDADTKTVWYASLYDASQYKPDDLSYLSDESAWMGDTASLLEASARTELLPLLSDTYRNARPVMLATDNALYAAFVRADADSGARYVVVTKFDGTSWSEPIRADTNAVLDSTPLLCADGDTVYLAYARTTENPGDSLLSYALKQEIVVGSIDPNTLFFTKQATFSGIVPDASFVSMPQLSAVNGQTLLAWVDSTVSDDNSVLRPASGVVRYAVCSDGIWRNASDMGTVNAPVDSITIGERNAAPAIVCLLDEDSGSNLYLLTASGQERIAENVSGTVAYAKLPGSSKASFLWNGENVLTSSDGNSAEVPGISGEYTVSGNNIYYSAATEGSANLTVLQYHAESGTWGLPIQLTDESRYLENLSVASLNGTDYVLGMHTAATITENAVEDAKNLVWSAVKPVSDLRLDGIDYDAENVKAGESLPVTLTVVNAGDHTVNHIAVTLNNSAVKTQECSLKPGESLDIEVAVPVSESLSECLFAVAEPEKDDYSPDNNQGTVKIGYADAAIELEYQQIGTKKALMASVTNRGVEAASGNIVFYDANGSSVAESAFTDLASADTTIAVYELDESFAGINGGDVSARVTLEQEELYAYNNADTLHIMETESNPEKTEIVSAVANGERGLSADIACESEITATAYCAFYNSDGKMLSVEIRPLSTGRNSLAFTASDQAASKAKIFVLDNQLIPQCASNAVEIT
ncbi:MAG: hypothetical protein IJQ81_07795 [Oscillibacter sp.]|nr:hypothetical protein [Oscillibacter sp.]